VCGGTKIYKIVAAVGTADVGPYTINQIVTTGPVLPKVEELQLI